MALLIVALLALAACWRQVRRMTRARGSRWGVNADALLPGRDLRCPHCGHALPRLRKPANLRQALWGGGTCRHCGREYDKWLRQL